MGTPPQRRRPSLRAAPCGITSARARTHAQESVVESLDQDASRPHGRGTQSIDLAPLLVNGHSHSRLRGRGVCQRCRRATATCPTLTAEAPSARGLSVDDVTDRRSVSPCLEALQLSPRVLRPGLQQCQSTRASDSRLCAWHAKPRRLARGSAYPSAPSCSAQGARSARCFDEALSRASLTWTAGRADAPGRARSAYASFAPA